MSKSTFASLMTGKMVCMPGAWSKKVVPILLMSNECVLGITCNKPIRISSPIPFKRKLCSRGFVIYTVEFTRAKTEHVSREET